MKIILSRKGFDSSNGGMPSPIFPSGKMTSLPIPVSNSPTTFNDIYVDGRKINGLISDLSKQTITHKQHVHLDPDIDCQFLIDRPEGWRGAFGQAGAAQKHLSNNCVGKDDLFIFFGWFREIEQYNQVWRFKHGAPDLHVIYGWLFVEEVISLHGKEKETLEMYPWLKRHPHLSGIKDVQNTTYIGQKFIPSTICASNPGYGIFTSIRDIQILTDTSQNNRSVWKLPGSFYPTENKPPLSYHTNKDRWKINCNKYVTLNSVGRGQEFILDTKYYPDVKSWLNELFS